jgi:hypothetical protein
LHWRELGWSSGLRTRATCDGEAIDFAWCQESVVLCWTHVQYISCIVAFVTVTRSIITLLTLYGIHSGHARQRRFAVLVLDLRWVAFRPGCLKGVLSDHQYNRNVSGNCQDALCGGIIPEKTAVPASRFRVVHRRLQSPSV